MPQRRKIHTVLQIRDVRGRKHTTREKHAGEHDPPSQKNVVKREVGSEELR